MATKTTTYTTADGLTLQPYYRQIFAPDVPATPEETVYYTSWQEACDALTAIVPDAHIAAGYWGRVTDPRTGTICYRDGLCLD